MVRTIALLLLSVLLTTACNKTSEKTAQFRGPNRDGIYPGESLLKKWPAEGPEEVFYTEGIGHGYGSPVISRDLLYVTGTVDSTAVLYCYDLSGNKRWDLNLGPEWVTNYPGSRSAPTIIDQLLYTATGFGDLFCISLADSSILWSKSLENDFNGPLPRFGHSESPAVHQNMVFWTAGGEEHNVVALDRRTGELLWSSPGKKERSAYNPPRIITTPSGRNLLLTFSAYHLMALDAETGELLWTHEQDNYPLEERQPGYGDTHANTVIYEDNNVYYAAGDGNCGVKLTLDEEGALVGEQWRNKSFDSYMGGIIKIGQHLYGSGTAKPFLYSIDAASGVLTDSAKIGRGVVIAADNMIYFYSQNGTMHLVSSTEGKMESISSFRIQQGTREHFAHPVIDQGILYVRHGDVIIGYNIRKEES